MIVVRSDVQPSADASEDAERRALVLSIVAAAALGSVAVAWGVFAESRVLLFDGLFLVLGIVLSSLSLLAAAAAGSAPSRAFPFGKRAAMPLAIGVQGAALLGTLLYAAVDAVVVIRGGGVEVSPGTVLGYGAGSAAVSLVVVWRLRRTSTSELVLAEVAQWRAGALLSAVIAVGGLVAVLLDGSAGARFVPFADPLLVLVACALTAPVPLRMLRDSGLELLEAAPPTEVQAAVVEAALEARSRFGLPEPQIAATKLGDRLYVEVVFVVADDRPVSDEDAVRRAIVHRLASLGYDVWANIELTTDRGLAI
ncbi:MAG TPA: cation transporter [Nocardioides sp.]|nr:cation transporter [Nocardioides sp.]